MYLARMYAIVFPYKTRTCATSRLRAEAWVNTTSILFHVQNDGYIMSEKMSQVMSLSLSKISDHFKKIGNGRKTGLFLEFKWNPNGFHLNSGNKRRVRLFEVCPMLPLRNSNDLFFDRRVMCSEIWIIYDNRKCSSQWLD